MSRASLAPDSPRNVVRTVLIFSASDSWMTMSCTFTVLPLFLTEFAHQDHAGDGVEGVEHAVATHGHGLEVRDLTGPPVQHELHVFEGRDVREVALVVLHHVGHLVQVVVVLAEVFLEVAEALHVVAQPVPLRVGHEHEPIHPAQDELARHVVVDLPRHRIELELGGEPAHGGGGDGQEVEEERTIVARGEGNHVPLAHDGETLVDVLEVRGLPRHSRAVVHDLEVDDLLRVVDDRHGLPQASLSRAAVRSTCRRASPGRPVSLPATTRICPEPVGAGSLRISTRVFSERRTAEWNAPSASAGALWAMTRASSHAKGASAAANTPGATRQCTMAPLAPSRYECTASGPKLVRSSAATAMAGGVGASSRRAKGALPRTDARSIFEVTARRDSISRRARAPPVRMPTASVGPPLHPKPTGVSTSMPPAPRRVTWSMG